MPYVKWTILHREPIMVAVLAHRHFFLRWNSQVIVIDKSFYLILVNKYE